MEEYIDEKLFNLGLLVFHFFFNYHRLSKKPGTSWVAQLVKNPPAIQETLVQFLVQEDPQRRDRLPTPVFLGFPCGSDGKGSACYAGDLDLIPGLGRSPG